MNLHQFQFVQSAVRNNLNLTEAARSLKTSQPGLSKAIIELEQELGIRIFERHGKRLKNLTAPGRQAAACIDIILREIGNLKRISEEFAHPATGTLSIATTHTQACYVLPGAIAALRKAFPQVRVVLHQGSPREVARMVREEYADLGIAAEVLTAFEPLVTLPVYEWRYCLLVPPSHRFARSRRVTLEALATEPIITYHEDYAGRGQIDKAFAERGIRPNIVLDAMDADVIKTYARLGMGVGIAADMALGQTREHGLTIVPAGKLFGMNVSRAAFKRGVTLRNYVYAFCALLSPRLTREAIDGALTRAQRAAEPRNVVADAPSDLDAPAD